MFPTTSTSEPSAPAFFEEYYDRILHYIQGLVHDQDEAEDLTQETFLRAYKERSSLHDPAAMLSWLYRIATHVSLDRLRQRARRAPRESETDLDEVEIPDPGTPLPEQTAEQEEMSECVQKYLGQLPDSYRAVILFHDVHGLKDAEIAELLNLPLATVKMRLHRARNRLQAILKEACGFSHDERNVLVCEPKE